MVPLAVLLAAIREERRYVRVGAHGFARIEETLRRALAGAEGSFFEHRGTLQVSRVGSDPLIGLCEARAQIEASDAFTALRRRIEEGAGAQPDLPAALDRALRPYQKAGVDLDGAPGALGGGGDPRRRDGPGKDHPDPRTAAAPVGERRRRWWWRPPRW